VQSGAIVGLSGTGTDNNFTPLPLTYQWAQTSGLATPVTLTNALSISATQNGVRPTSAAVDFTTPGGQEVLRALLNTPAGQPVSISATFAGGMSLTMPVHMSVAVNHDVLAQMVH